MTDVVAYEVAEQEFERFAEGMGLDFDESSMNEESVEGFRENRRVFLKAVREGALIVNENDEAVYTPQRPLSKYQDPITFHEPTGATFKAVDGKKKNNDVEKTYAAMGQLAKLPPVTFVGLAGKDFKVCLAVFTLLTA